MSFIKNSNYILFLIAIIILLASGCTPEKNVLEQSQIDSSVINSKIIDRDMNITVYLPKGYGNGEKYPVLYALHGAYGNEWDWFKTLGADSCADKLISLNKIKPMIIVSTETLNNLLLTWDSQNPNRDLFEEYICKELVPYIDSHYDTVKSNKSRYIGGISMGGFIAIQTALHNPKMFGKTGGHSPTTWISDYSDDSFDSWLYPGDTLKNNTDLVKFAGKKGLLDIKVFLDCGKDDFGVVDNTSKIHESLIKRGIDSTCIIGEGGHTTDYWSANMEKYLEFYNK